MISARAVASAIRNARHQRRPVTPDTDTDAVTPDTDTAIVTPDTDTAKPPTPTPPPRHRHRPARHRHGHRRDRQALQYREWRRLSGAQTLPLPIPIQDMWRVECLRGGHHISLVLMGRLLQTGLVRRREEEKPDKDAPGRDAWFLVACDDASPDIAAGGCSRARPMLYSTSSPRRNCLRTCVIMPSD